MKQNLPRFPFFIFVIAIILTLGTIVSFVIVCFYLPELQMIVKNHYGPTIILSSLLILDVAAWILFYNFIRRWKNKLELTLQERISYSKGITSEKDSLLQRISQQNNELNAALNDIEHIQDELFSSNKMVTIGQLVASITHEINNPLSYVTSNVRILQKRLTIITGLLDLYKQAVDENISESNKTEMQAKITQYYEANKVSKILADLDDLLNESNEGLARIKKIVMELKSITGPEEELLHDTNINNCIESAIEIVLPQIKNKCTIIKKLTVLPSIVCYPNQIKLVLINLLLNAAQAITEQGEITIFSIKSQNEIVISIHDTGVGIPEENLDKLFVPFFSTHPIGTASGLGLAKADRIIKNHGGKISVESTLNHGSTFIIHLPIST